MRYPCSVRLLPSGGRRRPVICSPHRIAIGMPGLEALFGSAALYFEAARAWELGATREGHVEFMFWDEFPEPLQGRSFEVRDGPYVVGEGIFL